MTRPRWHRLATPLVHRTWALVQRLGVVTSESPSAARFGTLGEGTVVGFPLSSLHGERSIHIGRDGLIAPWVTLGAGYLVEPNHAPERALVIGDRCWIGLRSTIVAHESVVIGDDVWFGQNVFVTDANHGYEDLETPIGMQLGAHQSVSIGAGSWIGHGAVILPGASVGAHVVVAAGAVVRGDIPDNCVVGGVPARIIKRLGDH